MTTGNSQPLAAHAPIQPLHDHTQPTSQDPAAPAAPSKRDLTSWWKTFKRTTTKKEDENKGMCMLSETSGDTPVGTPGIQKQGGTIHIMSRTFACIVLPFVFDSQFKLSSLLFFLDGLLDLCSRNYALLGS